MDEIERTIRLPEGANPLSSYGRNYAYSGESTVIATYLKPLAPIDSSERCEMMLKNGDSRPCTKAEIKESVKSRTRDSYQETPAGQRRWYNDARDLPEISDGKCDQINVEYEIATHHFVRISCNGIG